MSDELSLKLVHLYPDEMNIYGDMGNISTLKRRCEWRGIKLDISSINLSDSEAIKGDLYFMGGGQDNDMYNVFEDLNTNKSNFIKEEIESNKLFLLICGGFQLFGDYFLDFQGRTIKGLGVIHMETKAPSDKLQDRCLGNLVSLISPDFMQEITEYYPGKPSKYLVGFENHSGQTFITSDDAKPLGDVLVGSGNNSKEKIEGILKNNIIGSYMHGSLLPKNPHLADYIIGKSLEIKYGTKIELDKLDDTTEWQAHNAILRKMKVDEIS